MRGRDAGRHAAAAGAWDRALRAGIGCELRLPRPALCLHHMLAREGDAAVAKWLSRQTFHDRAPSAGRGCKHQLPRPARRLHHMLAGEAERGRGRDADGRRLRQYAQGRQGARIPFATPCLMSFLAKP